VGGRRGTVARAETEERHRRRGEEVEYLKVEAPLVRGSDRSWAVSKARTTIAYVIVRRFGYRLKDLSANFGREAATTGTLLARIGERLQMDLKRKLDIDRLIRKVKL
jgi:hypothetical protein